MGIMRWKLPQAGPGEAARMAGETGLPEILCRVLAARGMSGEEAMAFLAEEGELGDPFLLRDMDQAVERIQRALEQEERIAVYGDYDCDGVTSTALLTSYLQSVGADAFYYIPSREREGYGLNREAVEGLAAQGVNLIVTVDNGIAAHKEIARAGELGMDVVVTDHHTPRETLPEAAAVVNPHRADCESGRVELAGVGVAFKLVCALEGGGSGELLEYYSDLAALGTVADVVPLTGENRIIVRHGLSRMVYGERPGLAALLEVSGLAGKKLTGESVAFGLAPRINAAGRMDRAEDAMELLLTDDPDYAREMAEALQEYNQERKAIEEEILASIAGMLAENPRIVTNRVLVLAGQNWHHGVVGIAAAKLVERYHKPCILFSVTDDGEARGSGRSVEGFSLIEAISACSGTLARYGGHAMAAGLTLAAQDLPAFTEELLGYAGSQHPMMPCPPLAVDGILPPEALTVGEVGELSRLEPFGCANEPPLFLLENLAVEALLPTADRKHLRVRLGTPGGQHVTAIYFRMTEGEFPLRPGDRADVLAALSVGEYNGAPQLSVRIRDARGASLDQEALLLGLGRYECHVRGEYGGDYCPPEEALPAREDLAAVYKYIRRCGTHASGPEGLYLRLPGTDYCRMLVALDVLEELGLLRREGNAISLVEGAGKVDLEQSCILRLLREKQPVPAGRE